MKDVILVTSFLITIDTSHVPAAVSPTDIHLSCRSFHGPFSHDDQERRLHNPESARDDQGRQHKATFPLRNRSALKKRQHPARGR